MTDKQKAAIELKLTDLYKDLNIARESGNQEWHKRIIHYSQGMAYTLGVLGYSVIVQDGKVFIEKN